MQPFTWRTSLSGTLALLAACGCGSPDEETLIGPGGNGANGQGASGAGTNGQGASGQGLGGRGDGVVFMTGTGSTSGFDECAAESVQTEAAPLDIYILFDQSCSMSCPPDQVGTGLCCMGGPNPRIDQVRSAVSSFLQSQDSAGIGVGIGYFGFLPAGSTSCDPGTYSNMAVGIDLLPNHAQAVLRSLNSVQPTGETPTGAAIRGACVAVANQKAAVPGRNVVILLVTDGVPEAPVTNSCNPSLPDAVEAAQGCGAPIYVLGVGGNLDNLSQLAAAGGTGDAYLVGPNTNVTSDVLAALNQIRDSAAVPCDFRIPDPPDGEQLDYSLVNVTFRDAAGQTNIIGNVRSGEQCDEGGWHYDNPQNPTTVRLCSATCNTVTTALIAGSVTGRTTSLELQYGCGTIPVGPR